MTNKQHYDMKSLNDHILSMLENFTDTISKTDNQEEQLTYISSKIPTYVDRLEELSITKTQIHPLSLHIIEISSKLSNY